MKTTEIKCDDCGSDLTDSGPTPDYVLKLSCYSMPSTSPFMRSVMVYPPIGTDHHFCGTSCLTNWTNKGETK